MDYSAHLSKERNSKVKNSTVYLVVPALAIFGLFIVLTLVLQTLLVRGPLVSLNNVVADSKLIEVSQNKLALKKISNDLRVLGDSEISESATGSDQSNPESDEEFVTPSTETEKDSLPDDQYSQDAPSVIFNDPIQFVENSAIIVKFKLINNEAEIFTNLADDTAENNEFLNDLINGSGIKLQLSANLNDWYYFNNEGEWEFTTNGYQSSNFPKEINSNLNFFKQLYPLEEKLYVKIFLKSNGNTNVEIHNVIIKSAESSIQNPSLAPTSYNVNTDNIAPDNSRLPVPVIFQATFNNGNKIVYGKILNSNLTEENLEDYKVRIYFTDSTDISGYAQNKLDLIGETTLKKNQNEQITFLLITPSTEGGYVTAELTDGNEISGLSKPLENSTFTVDSTADDADESLDGVCATSGAVCTLRAAIAEANNVSGSDNIFFNIPTSDPGYRDYDTPTTPSSGDSAGGDDYWTITPASSYPAFTGPTVIDGSTQESNSGNDRNVNGPDIEIDGVNLVTTSSWFFRTSAEANIINGLVMNGLSSNASQAIMFSGSTSSAILTNSYIGIDVKGMVKKSNFRGMIATDSNATNIFIGTGNGDGNLFGGATNTNIVAICSAGNVITILGNRFGMNRTETAAVGDTSTTQQIQIQNDCDGTVGGPNLGDRNYIAGLPTIGVQVFTSLAANDTSRARIYNNFFGTDSTGTVNIGCGRALTVFTNNATVGQHPVEFGGPGGLGNLVRFCGGSRIINIEGDRDINILNNTIGDNLNEDIRINTVTGGSLNQSIIVRNNSIGTTANDPYFGLAIGPTTGFGIVNRYSSVIQGNIINNTTKFGIYNAPQNVDSRTNVSTDTSPHATIGGTSGLSDSLCNGLEQNCISGNVWGGIFSIDTFPDNEDTLYADNDFEGGNGPDGEVNIEQAWSGLFEIFSGDYRRTDLSGTVLNFPEGTKVRTTDDPATEVSSATAINVTCLNGSGVGCPASGHTSGTVDNSYIVVPSGQTSGILSNVLNWFRVSQYIYDNAGIRSDYDTFKFEQPHFASNTFTFDGDSTNNVINTGSSRTLNSQDYTDRGEPWTDKPSATRNISSGDLGRFQIMELDYVDANPIEEDGNQIITVDSSGNEDNVSLEGANDGDGTYSGGGGLGDDGLANGETTLQEALIVAKKLGFNVKINFPSTSFTPSNAINLKSDDTSNIVSINGNGLTFDGSSQPGGSNCIDIDNAYNFTIEGFIFLNCKNNAVKLTDTSGVELRNNLTGSTSAVKAIYNLSGGTEDTNGITTNDSGDSDTGANNLMNYPVIQKVTYLSGGKYRLEGILDNDVLDEGPFDLEVCLSSNHSSGHGGCIQTLEYFTDKITQVDSGLNPFSVDVTITGDNGTQNRIFTALATNSNGSTSEFSENFATQNNPNYFFAKYAITLVSPTATIDNVNPLFDWNANGDSDLVKYELYLDGTKVAETAANITEFKYTAKTLAGTHKWKVVGKRANGTISGESIEQSFNIQPTTTKLEIISPKGIIDTKTPLLDWNTDSTLNITSYYIYLNGALYTSVNDKNITEYQVQTELEESEYEWYVVAYLAGVDENGNNILVEVGRSETEKFEIKSEDVDLSFTTEVREDNLEQSQQQEEVESTQQENNYLVWICLGSLLVFIILVGVVVFKKRTIS